MNEQLSWNPIKYCIHFVHARLPKLTLKATLYRCTNHRHNKCELDKILTSIMIVENSSSKVQKNDKKMKEV